MLRTTLLASQSSLGSGLKFTVSRRRSGTFRNSTYPAPFLYVYGLLSLSPSLFFFRRPRLLKTSKNIDILATCFVRFIFEDGYCYSSQEGSSQTNKQTKHIDILVTCSVRFSFEDGYWYSSHERSSALADPLVLNRESRHRIFRLQTGPHFISHVSIETRYGNLNITTITLQGAFVNATPATLMAVVHRINLRYAAVTERDHIVNTNRH